LIESLFHVPGVDALILVLPDYPDKTVPVVRIQVCSFCITPVLIPRGITSAIFLGAGILNSLLHWSRLVDPKFVQFFDFAIARPSVYRAMAEMENVMLVDGDEASRVTQGRIRAPMTPVRSPL
jgi:hypothetical protein